MCGSMTWWYVTPSERYSSHLMMLILFEHSPQRGFGKGLYLLILFRLNCINGTLNNLQFTFWSINRKTHILVLLILLRQSKKSWPLTLNPKCLWWTNFKSGPPKISLVFLLTVQFFCFKIQPLNHVCLLFLIVHHLHLIFLTFLHLLPFSPSSSLSYSSK